MGKNLLTFAVLVIQFLSFNYKSFAQGEVYLVLGSDTAIWDGMSTSKYNDTYNLKLYIDKTANAYKVMEPSFREQMKDSYGNTLKMTWWMMAGNIFRYATNTNIPLPNIMTLYLMKKYHGDMIKQLGDELSLHYHTFAWTDYNKDGKYYWNQALSFEECKNDFDVTLSEFLLEENLFPVSFRSGWHYMDNSWQHYLNEYIPFSMHDDYPAVRTDTSEPLGNTYDWSKSSSEFVPFQPSDQNYQLPGGKRGYNVRSIYMARMDTTLMSHVFSQAQKGISQVACIWAHLPESDFPDNIKRINDIVHKVAVKFPKVKFRYCTATEAMQRWLKSSDKTKPELTLQKIQEGNKVSFIIKTDEPIFQTQPYFAVKTVSEKYFLVACEKIGTNEWKTSQSFKETSIAKVGAAVTDTVGNLAIKILRILPDDIFIDNIDDNYSEIKGNWQTSQSSSWGLNSREVVLTLSDTVSAKWEFMVPQNHRYNIYVQIPALNNPANQIQYKLYDDDQPVDSVLYNHSIEPNDWDYLFTPDLQTGKNYSLKFTAFGDSSGNKQAFADVIKISPLVQDRNIFIPEANIDFGMVSIDDSISYNLTIKNNGLKNIDITGISSVHGNVTSNLNFPLSIDGMNDKVISLTYHPLKMGRDSDTLFVLSNDSAKSNFAVHFTANVLPYFQLADNEDSLSYSETGTWHTSVAQAHGRSSRYAPLHQSPPATADFTFRLKRTGIYDISEIVPETVNAAKHALYVVIIENVPVDSVYIDQNAGSGDFINFARSYIPANVEVKVRIIDSGENTSNAVLRADAIKFSMVKEITGMNDNHAKNLPDKFKLFQNYPNPFNPVTRIEYNLPDAANVTLEVFDVLGRKVQTLVSKFQKSGSHSVIFNAGKLASGIYFYKIHYKNFIETRKMMLLK